MKDRGAQGSIASATTVQPDRAASSPVQIFEGSSGLQDGDVVVEAASSAGSVQKAAAAPAVAVPIRDGGVGSSDGEVQVHTVAAAEPMQKANPATSSVEVTEGEEGLADGSIKVEIAAGTAAKAAKTSTHMSDNGSGRARSDTEVMPEAYKPASQPNWLFSGNSQAGSELADAASAAVSSDAKAAVDSIGSDGADDHSVEVIVDASLLG